MEELPREIVPQVSFSLQELEAMAHILRRYSQYLQKAYPSKKVGERIHTIEQLQGRLAEQLITKDVKQVQLFLTVVELEELLTVLHDFVSLIKRLFPKSDERDATVATVNVWQLRLGHIMREFDM